MTGLLGFSNWAAGKLGEELAREASCMCTWGLPARAQGTCGGWSQTPGIGAQGRGPDQGAMWEFSACMWMCHAGAEFRSQDHGLHGTLTRSVASGCAVAPAETAG